MSLYTPLSKSQGKRADGYLPLNFASLFSKKAFIPSFWSSVSKHRAKGALSDGWQLSTETV